MTEASPASPPASASPVPVGVLVVDDEVITASAHAAYLSRVGGFETVAIAHTGHDAIRHLRASAATRMGPDSGSMTKGSMSPGARPGARTGASGPDARQTPPGPDAPPGRIDLMLLDMNLPDTHGLDLCRQIRTAGLDIDVIAITAVREVSVVRASVSLGIVQYLIKPFTFPTFADRMRAYLEFRRSFANDRLLATQGEVDSTLGALRTAAPISHDKGLSEGTLQLIVAALAASHGALSATELSDAAAVSRVTARRYLEHLVGAGVAEKSSRYGTPGRPEVEYRLTRR